MPVRKGVGNLVCDRLASCPREGTNTLLLQVAIELQGHGKVPAWKASLDLAVNNSEKLLSLLQVTGQCLKRGKIFQLGNHRRVSLKL